MNRLKALVLIGSLALALPVQATTIDVTGLIFRETYVGSSLSQATAFNFGWPTQIIQDTPGVSQFQFRNPTVIGSGSVPFTFSTAGGAIQFGLAPEFPGSNARADMLPSASDDAIVWVMNGNDAFTEALTSITSITRDSVNDTIAVAFAGVVNDSLGQFVNAPATASLFASEDQGSGKIGFMSFDPEVSNTPAVPEAGTFAMFILGLIGMGWLARRRIRRAS